MNLGEIVVPGTFSNQFVFHFRLAIRQERDGLPGSGAA